QDAIASRHFGVRKEIGTQRIAHHADLILLPGDVTEDRIGGYAHDLGVEAGELFQLCVIGRHLAGSSRRPVKNVEGDDHVLLAPQGAETKTVFLLSSAGLQIEVGCGFAYGQSGHRVSTGDLDSSIRWFSWLGKRAYNERHPNLRSQRREGI